MAFEARSHFPEKTIHITNEIIHNPEVDWSNCSVYYLLFNPIVVWKVNEKLLDMNVKFMDGKSGKKDYSVVGSGDVVILPAFGATIQEMQLLDEKYAALSWFSLF